MVYNLVNSYLHLQIYLQFLQISTAHETDSSIHDLAEYRTFPRPWRRSSDT